MAVSADHRSLTVVPKPCCHRLYPSNRRDVFLTLPSCPLSYRPFHLHATSKFLYLLDSPSRLDPYCQVAGLLADSTLPASIADCEGDPRPTALWSPSSVLVATMAFGFSWSAMLLQPDESGAASGGRMGGSSFGSSSRSSSGSGSSSYYSSLGSSSHTSSSYGFSFGSDSRSLEQETELVASVEPARSLSAPATVQSWASYLSFLTLAFISGAYAAYAFTSLLVGDGSTILKLQVGLLGTARSLQEDLDRIAKVSDPSTKYGLHSILTETTLALLRHPDYFSFGFSNIDIQRNIEHCEERFNWISMEERAKTDEETLVNTVSFRSRNKSRQRSDGLCNEYIVVTILLAAEGKHELLAIHGRENMKEALNKLASISSSKILALEVLWTPQDMNDILTAQELMMNYPLLSPL